MADTTDAEPIQLVFGFATPDEEAYVDTILGLIDFVKGSKNPVRRDQ